MEKIAKCCVPFGVLVFLVGLIYFLKDLGYIAIDIGMWPLLVMLFGVCMIGCGYACKSCMPATE